MSLLEGVGARTAESLITNFGEGEEGLYNFFNAGVFEIAEKGEISLPFAQEIINEIPNAIKNAEEEYEYTLRRGIETLFFTDKEYPEKLLLCPDFPLLLYIKGKPDFNNKKIVSIVGTRRATEHGKRLCEKFVHDLASFSKDIIIVSGLAYGIDITSHKAALDARLKTYGIIAGGMNCFYPKEHEKTADLMSRNGGGFITEQTRDMFAMPALFARRNRIIAGMADATVVVESTIDGGSLITAKMAMSYNRDIFAFPGRVGERLSEGCNNFIKYNRAGMIENADDFLYFMGWNINGHGKRVAEEYLNLNENEKLIYELLEKEKTVHRDTFELSFATKFNITETLFNMELKGIIEHLPGNFFSLI